MIFCIFLVCLPGVYTNGACPVLFFFCISRQCKWAEGNWKKGRGMFRWLLLHCTNFKINKEPMHSKGAFGFVLFHELTLFTEDETTILALACERWNARSCQRRPLRVDKKWLNWKSWQKENCEPDIRCPSLFLPQMIWTGLSCSWRINEIRRNGHSKSHYCKIHDTQEARKERLDVGNICVCGSSSGRKGMNSLQTLATQTEAFRAAFISVQPIWEKYKRHRFEGRSKSTLKCGWTPPNMQKFNFNSSLEHPEL